MAYFFDEIIQFDKHFKVCLKTSSEMRQGNDNHIIMRPSPSEFLRGHKSKNLPKMTEFVIFSISLGGKGDMLSILSSVPPLLSPNIPVQQVCILSNDIGTT